MEAKESRMMSLPALQPKVNYRGFPRRYEETKPVVVQEFTHRRILNLGNMIQQQTLTRCSFDKENAVREAERAVWEQAEMLKRETVEAALAKIHFEHEKVIKKLIKAHEKALKEEAVRVEGEMQKLALEQVQETQAAGERKLEAAVVEARRQGDEALVLAVAKARKEEQEVAEQHRVRILSSAEQKLRDTIEAAAVDKQQALRNLQEQKDEEQRTAVAEAHTQEQQIATKKLADQKEFYEQNIRILQTHIAEKKREIVKLEADVEERIRQKEVVRKELVDTRDEFSLFISRVRPFNDTESGFLLPPAKTISSS